MINWTILVNAVRLLFLLIPMMYSMTHCTIFFPHTSLVNSKVYENKKTAILLRFMDGSKRLFLAYFIIFMIQIKDLTTINVPVL
jgi:hypothetical protein